MSADASDMESADERPENSNLASNDEEWHPENIWKYRCQLLLILGGHHHLTNLKNQYFNTGIYPTLIILFLMKCDGLLNTLFKGRKKSAVRVKITERDVLLQDIISPGREFKTGSQS